MTTPYAVQKYTNQYLNVWNDFLLKSANGTFLLDRNYLSYHKNRFTDHSLMVFKNRVLLAILPAHICDGVLYSHRGLTFGGLVVLPYIRTQDYSACWQTVINYCKAHFIRAFEYKPTPTLFHSHQEVRDIYLIQHLGAELQNRTLASFKSLGANQNIFSKGKRLNIAKAIKKNCE